MWPTVLAFGVPVTSPARIPAESSVHEFTAVQPYKLSPEAALVWKKVSPTPQVAGKTVPDLNGLVVLAPEKSTLLLCVLRSTRVWALATPIRTAANRSA